MKTWQRWVVTTGLAGVLCGPLGAQTIGSISIHGSRRFSSAQIIAASGLRLGEPVNAQVLAQAAQRLSGTGAFTSVQYSYQFQGGNIEADFQVRDNPDFLPVEFDNFVWFSRAQLQAALRTLPLYGPQLPNAEGSLTQAVQARLQALLRAHHLPGTVGHITSLSPGIAPAELLFYIRGARIEIASIRLPGSVPALANTIRAVIGAMHFGSYSRSFLQLFALKSLRPIFRDQGYLSVEFKHPRAEILPGKRLRVAVTLPVMPGPQYRLGSLTVDGALPQIPGNPQAEILRISQLRPGRILHYDRLLLGLNQAALRYSSRGYFAARLQAVAHLHPLHAMVNYHIHIHPGPAYTMGRIIVEGWGPRKDARIAKRWRLPAGAVYNQAYVNGFWRSLHGSATLQEVARSVSHHVNVIFRNKLAAGSGLPD